MSPENPIPLTLEEHRELGEELRTTGARLRELSHMVAGIYGPQNRAVASFRRVTEAMDRLRYDLERQAAVDLQGYPSDGLYS